MASRNKHPIGTNPSHAADEWHHDLFCDCTKVIESTRSSNRISDRCRQEAIEIARRSWKKWKMEPRLPCQHQLCRRIIKVKCLDYWMKNDQLPRTYCRQICRWIDGCQRFFEKIVCQRFFDKINVLSVSYVL